MLALTQRPRPGERRRSRRSRSSSRTTTDRHAAVAAHPAHPASATGRRTTPSRCSTTCSPTSARCRSSERTPPAALDALQLADALADAAAARRRARRSARNWASWACASSASAPSPSRCSSTRNGIVVQAGKPVEIVFENTDLMPHNFVITQPGVAGRDRQAGRGAGDAAGRPGAALRPAVEQGPARQQAAAAARVAEAAASPPRRSRASIPTSAPIPATGGGCTAPCTSSPTSTSTWPTPKATSPRTRCRSQDELLEVQPAAHGVEAATTWPPRSSKLKHGRSFANGKQMFTGGHLRRLPQVGRRRQRVRPRPDQARLRSWQAGRHPQGHRSSRRPRSTRSTRRFVFDDEVGQGRHRHDPRGDAGRRLKVIENPLAKAEPLILKKADIADRKKSPTSIMPKGLLDKLTPRGDPRPDRVRRRQGRPEAQALPGRPRARTRALTWIAAKRSPPAVPLHSSREIRRPSTRRWCIPSPPG